MAKESFAVKEKEILPFKCSIGMGPYSVNVFSEYGDFLSFFEGQGENYIPWIPGWWVDRSPSDTDYSIDYIPAESSEILYAPDYHKLKVYGEPQEFYDGQSLAYLCFWLTEAQRQADGIMTSHAAGLSNNGKGILLFGERGDGKTSVALALGREYGYKLLANDLAIIGYDSQKKHGTIYDGTKIFGLRLSAIRGRFPELLHLFPDQTQRSWTTKAFVYPEEIGVEIETEPQGLNKAFMVFVDSTKTDKLTVEKMDDLWTRNYFYENLSRYLRGTAIVPFGATSGNYLGFLPSLDTPNYHQKRLQLIGHLIDDIGVWNVSGGNLDEIKDFIHHETF